MFNKEKTTTTGGSSNSATLVSPGTILKGDINSDNDLRIDGIIHGNVTTSSKIIVGPTGYVEGNVEGLNADITGKVLGNVNVKELLQLREKCIVDGNIAAGKLQIEPSATFNGQCQMGNVASIVQMTSNDLQAEAK